MSAKIATASSKKAGHRKLTAHKTARYRCFLPDLAGLAGFHRVRPMSDQLDTTTSLFVLHSRHSGKLLPCPRSKLCRYTILETSCRGAPSRPVPPSAPPEIDRLFQTSLFLLVVTGFGTLAATGKLDLISVLFVIAALVLRAYSLLRGRPCVIPRRITSWLAVVYFLIFFVDFFFVSGRDLVTPAVHLVLFGMCVKLFNVERDRDYVYLAVLSFLMVLAAAILTVDSAFLAAFALFLVLAVFCFMAMEMRRSALAASNAASLPFPACAPAAGPSLPCRGFPFARPYHRRHGRRDPGRCRPSVLRHAPHQRRLSLPLRPK